MGEIEKPQTWAEKQASADEAAKEILGTHNTVAAMEDIAHAEDLAKEHCELMDWYTKVWDQTVLGFEGKYGTDLEIQSAARAHIRATWPDNFDRVRELSKLIEVRNAKHQALGNAAHVSVIEANVRQTTLWV